MKTKQHTSHRSIGIHALLLVSYSFLIFGLAAQNDFNEYKGVIEDKQTGDPLAYATLTIMESNISTVTNTDGEFSLKVPSTIAEGKVSISFLGYKDLILPLSQLKSKKNRIALETAIVELSSIDISTFPSDAKKLVKMVLRKKGDNYFSNQTTMTAFYRETIKKRRKNVSLSEAVVNVQKQSYQDAKKDIVSLYKSRKNTDYTKLDTLALKLQGGPFNALYLDMMKYPEYIFMDNSIDAYSFNFEPSKKINDKLVYVVNFKQLPTIATPLYFGHLYIEANTLALTSAEYSLNLEDKKKTSEMFVRKKPKNVEVYPTETTYRVDYREKDGKWYYGYSNVQLTFKVNWKKKLFNSNYRLTSEMAITDWNSDIANIINSKDRIRPSIVIADEASGFSDPDFWGEYNVIEPEKSIESAINKIQRQLKRSNTTKKTGTAMLMN